MYARFKSVRQKMCFLVAEIHKFMRLCFQITENEALCSQKYGKMNGKSFFITKMTQKGRKSFSFSRKKTSDKNQTNEDLF